MSEQGSERLLTMSAFEAAYLLRCYRRENPAYSDGQLIDSIRAIRADFFPNDYKSGLSLEARIALDDEFASDDLFYRSAIEAIIRNHSPLWVRLAPGGRDHVMKAVSVNGIQCFRNAGLLQSPPPKVVADWWDALAAVVRSDLDARLLAQGREAERRSYELERERLKGLGIDLEPHWVSIDDNCAGFDIKSYNPGKPIPTNKLIEVKSSSRESQVFIITRGEWDKAVEYGEAYVFHFWNMTTGEMAEFPTAKLTNHMPRDGGLGRWLKAELSLSDLLPVPVSEPKTER